MITRCNEDSLSVFEREDAPKDIWPIVWEWILAYNNNLYELFSEPHVVKTIKIWRLRCAGHVIRMLDSQNWDGWMEQRMILGCFVYEDGDNGPWTRGNGKMTRKQPGPNEWMNV
jgi:hypothetical protein